MDSVSQMFSSLLERGGDIDPELQRQALRYSEKAGNDSIVVQLAGLESLDPKVEASILKSKNLDVLKAWASARGRDVDVIVKRLAKEKRVTLLEGLAGMPDLPQELYQDFASRGSTSLGWVLLGNPAVDNAVRLSVAGFLGERSTRTDSRCEDESRRVSRIGIPYLREFLGHSTNARQIGREVLRLSGETELSDQGKEVIQLGVSRLVAFAAAGDADMAGWLWHIARQTDEQDLLAMLNETIQQAAANVEDPDSPAWRKALDAGRLAAKRAAISIEDVLSPIKAAGDAASISAAVNTGTTVLRDAGYYVGTSVYAQYVLDNPNVDTRLLAQYRHYATSEQLRKISERAIQAQDRDLAVLAMDMDHGPVDLVSEHYAAAKNPEAFLTWLIGGAETAPQCLVHSDLVRSDKELAYRLLPIKDTIRLASTQARIAESLGSSQDAWDMFTTLANEWSGSVPDLLATVLSLSGNEK